MHATDGAMETAMQSTGHIEPIAVRIPTAQGATLDGDLALPPGASGIVLFAHGSGSGRHSPRNQAVAASLRGRGLGTLLMDLLTREEEIIDERTRHLRFDIDLLAGRLVGAMDWLQTDEAMRSLSVGLFGASTGAAAALIGAAMRPELVGAVVSRGGRPDLAGVALASVSCPTLLIVGGHDEPVIDLNRGAAAQMRSEVRLVIVPGATHLFEERGALAEVSRLAGAWFVDHLRRRQEVAR